MTQEEYIGFIDALVEEYPGKKDERFWKRVENLKESKEAIFQDLNITNMIRMESTFVDPDKQDDKHKSVDMSPDGQFFRYWAAFLKPLHELTNREMDVFAAFLKMRYQLSKDIINGDTLDRVLFQTETKQQIRESLNMKSKHFQVTMQNLRNRGVVVNDRIPLNLIPTIMEHGAGLMIYFSFKNEQRVKLGPQKGVQKT